MSEESLPRTLPQNFEKVPRNFAHRPPLHKQSTNHRYRIRPSLNHAARICQRDPPDRHNRQLRQRPRLSHQLQSHHRIRIRLRHRPKHRPHGDIIRLAFYRCPHLRFAMRRHANDPGAPPSTRTGVPSERSLFAGVESGRVGFSSCNPRTWKVGALSTPSAPPPPPNPPAPHAHHPTLRAPPGPRDHS